MSARDIDSEFVQHVQQALTGLYKPVELRRSPLIGDLGLNQQADHVAALRRALIDAIQALKPESNVSLQSNAWRVYHILTYRYLEQSSQKQVATDLALSIRQLRRDEDEAVRVLSDLLWTKHRAQAAPSATGVQSATSAPQSPVTGGHDHKQELDWLRDSFHGEYADAIEVTQAALGTLQPVLGQAQATVAYTLPPQSLPLIPCQPEVLKQAIINLLLAAVYGATAMTIQLELDAWQGRVRIRMQGHGRGGAANGGNPAAGEALDMTRELLSLFGGSLTITPGAAFDACLLLPVSAQVPLKVLIIDDHADAQQLMQRYLSGSRYQCHACRDPERALEMAVELAPRVIILDVMLPGTDGWELLGRLRLNPVTAHVPVIVSTFLPQEQMALTLGAVAFLRKPVTRQSLLEALDHQADSPSKESH